jgi:hypothetical protein
MRHLGGFRLGRVLLLQRQDQEEVAHVPVVLVVEL